MSQLSAEYAFPPGHFVNNPLYYEGIFTLATAPDLKTLVVISLRAATTGTGGSYFPRCLLIETSPVSVVPLRSGGHHNLLESIESY